MLSRKALFFFICSNIVLPLHANQVIYQWTDEKGELHFSDKQQPGAEKRIVKEVQSYQPLNVNKKQSSPKTTENTQQTDQAKIYKSIEFLKPQDNETIRIASANLPVSLSIEPEMSENHLIQFYLDDKAVGTPQKELTYTYNDVYRGSHTLSASIQDQNGKTLLSTKAITIFMHPPKINTQSKVGSNVFNQKRTIIVTQKVS